MYFHSPTSHHFPLLSGLFLNVNFCWSAAASIKKPIDHMIHPIMSSAWSDGFLSLAFTTVTGKLTVHTHTACRKISRLNFKCQPCFPNFQASKMYLHTIVHPNSGTWNIQKTANFPKLERISSKRLSSPHCKILIKPPIVSMLDNTIINIAFSYTLFQVVVLRDTGPTDSSIKWATMTRWKRLLGG